MKGTKKYLETIGIKLSTAHKLEHLGIDQAGLCQSQTSYKVVLGSHIWAEFLELRMDHPNCGGANEYFGKSKASRQGGDLSKQ